MRRRHSAESPASNAKDEVVDDPPPLEPVGRANHAAPPLPTMAAAAAATEGFVIEERQRRGSTHVMVLSVRTQLH